MGVTEHKTAQGQLYLSPVKDVYSDCSGGCPIREWMKYRLAALGTP